MQKTIPSNHMAQALKISARVTRRPETICIRVFDPLNPKAVYAFRKQKIFQEDTFIIKLPRTPKNLVVDVYNERRPSDPRGEDKSFQWSMKPVELMRRILPFHINASRAKEFVLLAQEFAEQAAIISAGYPGSPRSIYSNRDHSLVLHYYDVLVDSQTHINGRPNQRYGQLTTTSMRTDAISGVIEISKRYTVGAGWTIPMIIMVLLHEYSHFYVNRRPESEEEADRNAIVIFLCMGYSKIEAVNAWVKVFEMAPTPMNAARLEKVKKLVASFDMNDYGSLVA